MYRNMNPCLLSESDHNEVLYHTSSRESYIYIDNIEDKINKWIIIGIVKYIFHIEFNCWLFYVQFQV